MDFAFLKSISDALFSQFGLAGLIISLLGYLVYYLFKKILADKDEEIRRLSEENEKYRTKFISLLDGIHKLPPENENKK